MAKHPKSPNPKALLQTPYMTEENSELEGLTPEEEAELEKQVLPSDRQYNVKILELLRPKWRAKLVSQYID